MIKHYRARINNNTLIKDYFGKADYREGTLVVTDEADAAWEAVKEGHALVIIDGAGDKKFPACECYIEDESVLKEDFLIKMCQRKQGLPWTIAEDEEIFLREISLLDNELVPESIRMSRAKAESYIDVMYRMWGFGLWLIIRRSDMAVIGRAGLGTCEADTDGVALYDLGYEILPEYRKQGYAKRACSLILEYSEKELFIEKIALHAAADNLPSLALARSLGFKHDSGDRYIYEIVNEG